MDDAQPFINDGGDDRSNERYQLYDPENDGSNAADGVEYISSGLEHSLDPPDISKVQIVAYSIGHFLNDLCASMWFTYLLVYLEKVIQMHTYRAGFLMLLGQVTDAISTPLVGLLSDASVLPHFLLKYGKRKAWHIVGTLCVSLSFPFIFADCPLCHSEQSEWWKVLWFAPFIIVFQFGWASTQISHLALIPELSSDTSKRVSMNSYRNAFNVVANLGVYTCMYLLLHHKNTEKTVGPSDLKYFQSIGIGLIVVGLVVVMVFYWLVDEATSQARARRLSLSSQTTLIIQMSWRSWFCRYNFYLVALLFTLSRLYINVSQVYFPFYITLTRNLEKFHMATLPLTTYLSSFVVSCVLGISHVNQGLNRNVLFVAGSLIGLLISFLLYFLRDVIFIYFVAALLGIVQSLLLISSLGMTAQLINRNTETGAFVYGSMSFLDKLSNGLAFQVIELVNPICNAQTPPEACARFYRNVMSYIPGTCAIMIFIVLWFVNSEDLSRRSRPSSSIASEPMPDESVEYTGDGWMD